MITLFNFGRIFGLPDASPFVAKAELLLKIAGLPYELNPKGYNKAPKGKLPYIVDEGVTVADSTLIRFHIERKYGFNFNHGLTGERAAVLWAAERMCEEHLYWGCVYDRWIDEHNFTTATFHYFDEAPALIRPLIIKFMRAKVKKSLHAHGMGRHTSGDIHQLCRADIGVLSSLLGDEPYFGGQEPCGADACFGAFVTGVLCTAFKTPIRDEAEKYANLVEYRTRMMARFYPELTT